MFSAIAEKKENIVDLALLSARFDLVVKSEAVLAQSLYDFALLARLAKTCSAGVPRCTRLRNILFERASPFQ